MSACPDTHELDQKALLKWIVAGLSIPEVRVFHGNTNYILSNMIAKYTLAAPEYLMSSAAYALAVEEGFDTSIRYRRSRFYGKQTPFTYDHAIPVNVVRTQLLETPTSPENIEIILQNAGPVLMITCDENHSLNQKGLRQRMPDGWSWNDNHLARYDYCGISIAKEKLKVCGAIRR